MYIAIKGFCGQISARKDQIIEINDKKVAQDLLNAGYIEVYNEKVSNSKEFNKKLEIKEEQIKSLEEDKMSLESELEILKKQLLDSSNKDIEPTGSDVIDSNTNVVDDNISKEDSKEPTDNKQAE